MYYLVETDKLCENAEVLEEFEKINDAKKACKEKRKWKEAVNGMRASEGSKERILELYFVSDTKEFQGEWNKLENKNIIF